jgi:glutamate-5-semialdehyde dehydrogenase
MMDMIKTARDAKAAADKLAAVSSLEKNTALLMIAEGLVKAQEEILAANAADIQKAGTEGYKAALIERLTLTEQRIRAMAQAVAELANLEDPVGKVLGGTTRPNGLKILKTSVPLGVIGMIYESRPNVTVDAATLCLKAGNACILRAARKRSKRISAWPA